VKPYYKSIVRCLKKESKVYLWGFSEVGAPGPRLENCIATHLLKSCDCWTDNGHGVFDVRYVRNKEKQELDLVITRDGLPWLAVEAELEDMTLSPTWAKHLPHLAPC